MTPKQTINPAFLKLKTNRSDIDKFKLHLVQLLEHVNEQESEEFNKNLVASFLQKIYTQNHFINTKGRYDLVIHNGKKADSTVGVIIECKSLINKTEMLQQGDINKKALQELVWYYLQERIEGNNLEIKHLIVTNVNEWFIFDVRIFEREFVPSLRQQFTDFKAGRLAGAKTNFFYKEIAKPAIAKAIKHLEYTYFDLRDYGLQRPDRFSKPVRSDSNSELIYLFKLLSPEHLLKLSFINDSNSLDKNFYAELLHIIGLQEVKKAGKKLIQADDQPGALLENIMLELRDSDKLERLAEPEKFGVTEEERLFNVGLELVIIWINRILFLKLLEAQLISYHAGDISYAFLNLDRIENFHDLNSLFFQVLAKKVNERSEAMRFAKVPYLNSSLFEPAEIELDTLFISNLASKKLAVFTATVLKDCNGKKRTGKLDTLKYLFEFLNAYDFASEGTGKIQEENKSLINASVLGLIFEKINGYKDGSFFTPGFITMYMCRETIRRAVVQKFNECKGWNCKDIDDLYERIDDRKEANTIINDLKVCDPAVGSGHFLVSALNEIVAIKHDLRILSDRDGRRLKEYQVEVMNDELVVLDEDGELFEYKLKSPESQRVQEALFHEKQTIIENCLFGVDVNVNSVKICRLRLWIELLKHAYYKADGELETLPNIDINIKCGNSLISRFGLDVDLRKILQRKKWSIEDYQEAVATYRNAESKEQKREMVRFIEDIKGDLRTEIGQNDPKLLRLNKLRNELGGLLGHDSLFPETVKEKKAKEKVWKQLEKNIAKLEAEVDDIKNNKIYWNAFEWRFEFPEVLNDAGDFVGFDVVIGNPPYLNFKMYSKNERDYFSRRYYQIFNGKGDIYYYFIKIGLEILKTSSFMSYITSRYWIEAEFANKLRHYLSEQTLIQEITDFKNVIIFDGVGIKTSIVLLKNIKPNDGHHFLFKTIDEKRISDVNINKFNKIKIYNNNLINSSCWKLKPIKELALLDKIITNSVDLEQIANCKQGIVTGRDRAFITTNNDFDYLPKDFIKIWVKVGDVYKYGIKPVESRKLVYTNAISNIEDYPKLKNRLLEHKIKLENRREAKNGKIRWFDLQWARTKELFDNPKIICRFKASNNTFAIDLEGYYSSADITIVQLKNEWKDKVDLKYLLGILNSKLLNFYFKSYGKLMDYRYEYYPSPVGKLRVIIANDQITISQIVEKLIIETTKNQPSIEFIKLLEAEIDQLVYKLYGLTEEEIRIVEG